MELSGQGAVLSGRWAMAPADEELRRRFHDPAFDDTGWTDASVPAHWRTVSGFEQHDGPVLYRHRFAATDGPPAPGPRAGDPRHWLVFDGLLYQSDVWFDGDYLGDTEGWFFPHTFEVTEHLNARQEHLLAVDLTCSAPGDPSAKRNLTGTLQEPEYVGDWNPGGIWRPVRLETTGSARLRFSRLLCEKADESRARLRLRAVVDTPASENIILRTRVVDPEGVEVVDHRSELPLAAGENRREWTVDVPRPQRWWPRALGDQPLYTVTLEVHPISHGAAPPPLGPETLSDQRTWTTGLRRVELRDWKLAVNGERLFAKGVLLGPTARDLAAADPETVAHDIDLAADAGLDLVRVHAHVARPELYERADLTGMLVWQDLPLIRGYAHSVRETAAQTAREAVDLLGHHPSIAIWCGHDEPLPATAGLEALSQPEGRFRAMVKGAAAQALPTWNRTVLDRSVTRVLRSADPSRPIVAHSGVLPHPPSFDGTDTHLWNGWLHGEVEDLGLLLATWPRLGRWVTGLSAQSVPDSAPFVESWTWPELDTDTLSTDHGFQEAVFDRRLPRPGFPNLDSWRQASQNLQAHLVRTQVDGLRRLKYRPTGGFVVARLADAHPSISCSLLDHERRPKAAWDALTEACRPVTVIADIPPGGVVAGEQLAIQVHAVNDLRTPVADLEVTADLTWPGGELTRRWGGAIEPDSVSLIGTIEFDVPPRSGDLVLVVRMKGAGHEVERRHRSRIST
ncbi:MAG: hypothetical protein GY929_18975 [Actinomycetia bacterium]|nr:hypothetical protein [Actinomycetes bacterium]